MRQAHYLAIPLLTLSLGAFAQQDTSAYRPEPLAANAPYTLRTEAPPEPAKDRMVLNLSRAEFRIAYDAHQRALTAPASAAGAARAAAAPSGSPSSVDAAGSGTLTLSQPGLPAGIKTASAGPTQPAATTAPTVDVAPPAPVPQTMSQAAQTLPRSMTAAASKPAEDTDQPSPPGVKAAALAAKPAPAGNAIDKVKAYVSAHRQNALMAAAALVLLGVLGIRALRRRGNDESEE